MASILSPYVQVRKSKVKTRNKHVEADQKQQVVDCGTKQAWKTDTSEAAKCVRLYVTNTAYEVRQVEIKEMCIILHCICCVLGEFNKCS